jgi:hypothetical protein
MRFTNSWTNFISDCSYDPFDNFLLSVLVVTSANGLQPLVNLLSSSFLSLFSIYHFPFPFLINRKLSHIFINFYNSTKSFVNEKHSNCEVLTVHKIHDIFDCLFLHVMLEDRTHCTIIKPFSN